MPPRIALVAIFVACYFAVVAGGGAEAFAREAVVAQVGGDSAIRLTLGDVVVLIAGTVALIDQGLARSGGRAAAAASWLAAGAAVGAAAASPALLTPTLMFLIALAFADGVTTLLRPAAR